jgi:K(+)-stimulated pyrophosphate-energized sodium pump
MDLVILVPIAGFAAILFALWLAYDVLRRDTGTAGMQDVAALIFEGAMAFLRRQYTTIAIIAVIAAAALGGIVYAVTEGVREIGTNEVGDIVYGEIVVSRTEEALLTAIAFLVGAVCSALAGFIGMYISVRSNLRTASAAQRSLKEAITVALRGGAVSGFLVVALSLLGVSGIFAVYSNLLGNPPEIAPFLIIGFGFGASFVALFAQLGGGIYTKAADVGADLVGKVEAGIPEDDPRNPATIADNVGDNVGDVAGMGADLFESYVGAMVASLALTAIGAATLGVADAGPRSALVVLPLAIAGLGILASIAGTVLVRTGPEATMSRLLWALRAGIFGAGGIALALTAVLVVALELPFALFWVVLVGLVVGQVIGTGTEYFTSYEYRPTRWIAAQSVTGSASVIIAGLAVGMLSVVVPALAVVVGIWLANELAGLYGVALAAVGMLSTLGITLATDAYGPVADNAGGLAEQAHLAPEVRHRTDALDALGNTTAATGKGFAIGSAVLTALALAATYVQVTGITSLQLTDVRVLLGVLVGAMLPFIFSGLTMQAVGSAANAMIQEVRRQFREIPGLLEGLPGVEPDAARAVDISTSAALKAMLPPGALAVAVPIVVGATLGAEALGGLLIGSIASGFLLATLMANAGGAWDNAKKWIELGHHGGKGSDAHAAAVTGDTVGDPFKDTSGPSINILLKLTAIVAVIFGPLFL